MWKLLATVAAILLLYLSLWPVPVDPVAWQAPLDKGLTGDFAANERLRAARLVSLGEHSGPEDIVVAFEGKLCTGTLAGKIVCFDETGRDPVVFADTGGRPLGLDFKGGFLYVANAHLGLQRVRADGRVISLASEYAGDSLGYVDDVAVATDGMVYFSDASSKFKSTDGGSTYSSSVLDIIEHGAHGRIFRYDPFSNETTLLIDNLDFANGVAVSDDQQMLLISETGSYRIWRYWLEGPQFGEMNVLVDNLPGFPDNINNGEDGRYWIGLVSTRNSFADANAGRPFIRKLIFRLPQCVWPADIDSSHLISIDGSGRILHSLQDSSTTYPKITGAIEAGDNIYLSSLVGTHIAILPKSALRQQNR